MSPNPWSEVDAWADKQPRVRPARTKRPRVDYALRAQERIARGIHPTGTKLREGSETCGGCKHLIVNQPGANKYFKCAKLGVTHGPATDIRKRWPACISWEARDASEQD